MQMKIINKTVAFLLTCLFFLSNNGISIVLHHCLACDATDYYFATYTGEIEHHHHDNDHSLHENCFSALQENKHENYHSCGIFAGDNECCETEVQYLKIDNDLFLKNFSDKLLQPVFLPVDILPDEICCCEYSTGKLLQGYIEPPPKLVSKTFIIFTNQFKIF